MNDLFMTQFDDYDEYDLIMPKTFEDALTYAQQIIYLYEHKQDKLVAGDNITLTDNPDGTTTITATGGGQGGAGIEDITFVVGEEGTTVTIHLTDGTDKSFFVQRGIPGPKGDPGEPGTPGPKGDPGFSPIAEVTKSGDETTITITDERGTTQAVVKDGTTIPVAPTDTDYVYASSSTGRGWQQLNKLYPQIMKVLGSSAVVNRRSLTELGSGLSGQLINNKDNTYTLKITNNSDAEVHEMLDLNFRVNAGGNVSVNSSSSDVMRVQLAGYMRGARMAYDFLNIEVYPTIPAGGTYEAIINVTLSGTDNPYFTIRDYFYTYSYTMISAQNGIPAGGTQGQVLTKNSNIDSDATWQNPSGGGSVEIITPSLVNISSGTTSGAGYSLQSTDYAHIYGFYNFIGDDLISITPQRVGCIVFNVVTNTNDTLSSYNVKEATILQSLGAKFVNLFKNNRQKSLSGSGFLKDNLGTTYSPVTWHMEYYTSGQFQFIICHNKSSITGITGDAQFALYT